MSRNLTAGMQAAIAAKTVYPVILYEGEFVSGMVYFWSGVGPLSWNGNTYLGAGELGAISAIEETTEIVANGISCNLSGIPSSLISLALQESRQGKSGKLYLGLMDAGGVLIADPYLVFAGKLDIPAIDEGADTSTIAISYESELVDLENPINSRYTDEDQRRTYPTDQGFSFVASLVDKQIIWGG